MSVNITLEEIIKRKTQYCKNDTNEEMVAMNKGYVRGFEELLKDIDMAEDDFIAKYVDKVRELAKIFDKFQDGETISDDIDELSGYNNALVDVLGLLNEKFVFSETFEE